MTRPILTKIAGKFQVTVPLEIRNFFDLQEGDLFQWDLDEATGQIALLPKRAQLLTPLVRKAIDELRAERGKKLAVETAQQAVSSAPKVVSAEVVR